MSYTNDFHITVRCEKCRLIVGSVECREFSTPADYRRMTAIIEGYMFEHSGKCAENKAEAGYTVLEATTGLALGLGLAYLAEPYLAPIVKMLWHTFLSWDAGLNCLNRVIECVGV